MRIIPFRLVFFSQFRIIVDWEQRKLGDVYQFKYGQFNNNPDNGGRYPIYGANGVIGGYDEYNAGDSIVIGHMGAYAGHVLWAPGKHFVTYNGTIGFPKIMDFDKKFGYHMLQHVNIPRITAGSGQPFVSYADLESIKINISINIKEQTSIGKMLDQLDNAITLHQRKLDALKRLKEAYLQNMFPINGESVPKLRFANFGGKWGRRKLGEEASFTKGRGYSKGDLVEKGFPILLYGRLYVNYETVINEVDTFVEIKDKSVISEGIEIVIPSSGETPEDISRASVVGKSGIILGGDLNIIKPKNEIDSIFLALTISNGKTQKEISKRAQGKSVVHLYNSDLKKVVFLSPALKEQHEIGQFFIRFDSLITLHQNKLEQFQQLKQAYLQKLFI